MFYPLDTGKAAFERADKLCTIILTAFICHLVVHWHFWLGWAWGFLENGRVDLAERT